MPSLHVICHSAKYLTKVGEDRFDSGYWPISPDDADRLVGGMIYLHESKGERSYFGGVVERYRIAGPETGYDGRVVFTLMARREGRGAKWRGRADPMAFVGGVTD